MSDAPIPATLATNSPPVEPARGGQALRDRVRSLQLPPIEEQRGGRGWLWILLAGLGITLTIGWYSGVLRSFIQNTPAAATAPEPKTERPAEPPPSREPVKPSAPANETKAPSTPIPPPISKPASKGAPSRAGIVLESKGYIIPAHRIKVSPKVAGMLVELKIEEGMRVNKSDVLAVLEKIEYEADVKRAQATLALAKSRHLELKNGNRPEEIRQAEAELEEARAKLKELEADYKRAQQLIQRGNITQSEFDQNYSEFVSQERKMDRLQSALDLWKVGARDERVEQAAAEIDQADADLSKAKWRLDNCTIRAPVSGTILKKSAEEGDIVNPIAFNISATICDMADLSDLEADLNIQERDISKVFKGQKCKVRAEAYPDRVYDGYVDRLMPIADRAKGAVPVRVKISVPSDEEGIYLKPDMGAIVSFYAGENTAVSQK